MKKQRHMTIDSVLRDLGCRFSLDWDDELVVEYPETPVPLVTLGRVVKACREQLVLAMQCQRVARLRCFVGGPFNGKRHGLAAVSKHARRCFRIRRAWWAVYEARAHPWVDPRLFFLGYATSEAKGRRGQLAKHQGREGRGAGEM